MHILPNASVILQPGVQANQKQMTLLLLAISICRLGPISILFLFSLSFDDLRLAVIFLLLIFDISILSVHNRVILAASN